MNRNPFRRRYNPTTANRSATLTDEEIEVRKISFLKMIQAVKQGLHPLDAIKQMYESEPAWQIESLQEVVLNILGEKQQSRIGPSGKRVRKGTGTPMLYTDGELLGGSDSRGFHGGELRAIWKARRDYLFGVQGQAKSLAYEVEDAWDEEDIDSIQDRWEAEDDEWDEEEEERSVPMFILERKQESRPKPPAPKPISPHAYNIWIYTSGDSFQPYKSLQGEHIGSDSLDESMELLADAVIATDNAPLIVLPKDIGSTPFSIWERHADANVFVPATYKRKKGDQVGSMIHLGHADSNTAEKMRSRWEDLNGVETIVATEDDPRVPVKAYRSRHVSWRYRRRR